MIECRLHTSPLYRAAGILLPLRRRFLGNQLPIILVTAKVSDLEEGLSAGANDYLTKPFSKNELLARISTHLSLSRCRPPPKWVVITTTSFPRPTAPSTW